MKHLLHKSWMFMIGGLICLQLNAQTDVTMVMDPGSFALSPTAYYVGGVTKILNDCDPVNEQHYGGCDDAYSGGDHDEYGTQQGWQYGKAIIFHDCAGPGENQTNSCNGKVGTADKYHINHPDGWDTTEDFIQIEKHTGYATENADYGYIISPAFTNLKSLEIKTTTDISRQEGTREIIMMIEASFDGGDTWQFLDTSTGDAWLTHTIINQAGDIASYTDGGGDDGFQAIVDASKTEDSTMLRIIPFPFLDKIKYDAVTGLCQSGCDGQRVNIWEITIEAQTVPQDADGDGVEDGSDLCASTPSGATVDANGCAASQRDTDNDGVTDDKDLCANTPGNETADSSGCSDSQQPVLSALDELDAFTIRDNKFFANPGETLKVYNMSGKVLGRGQKVNFEYNTLYLVKTSAGKTRKVFIKQ